MSSAATPPAVARPSVFISYASEDRAAARALRDTLVEAGLEVWYDENELGGGDAWDQKIRRQIRECDYFMPLISATTERRKEGYFRREWRLAAERTMDMADDVLFLLPVVIDDTNDAGARVPDKFVAVQWLRAPGGQATPALGALIQRLLRGEHTAPPRPPLVARHSTASPMPPPPVHGSSPPPPLASAPHAAAHGAPPPMPHFPHAPEHGGIGQWLKFFAEVVWWVITAAWTVLMRMPKWIRFVLAVWMLFTVLGTCRNSSNNNARPRGKETPTQPTPPDHEAEKSAKEVASVLEKSLRDGGLGDFAKMGEEIARRYSKKPTTTKIAGKPLVLIPVPREKQDDDAARFTLSAFASCYSKLVVLRSDDLAISPVVPGLTTDDAWVGVAKQLGVDMVLGFRLAKTADSAAQLQVRLLRSADGVALWSGEFPVVEAEAVAVGGKVAEAVFLQLPKRE